MIRMQVSRNCRVSRDGKGTPCYPYVVGVKIRIVIFVNYAPTAEPAELRFE